MRVDGDRSGSRRRRAAVCGALVLFGGACRSAGRAHGSELAGGASDAPAGVASASANPSVASTSVAGANTGSGPSSASATDGPASAAGPLNPPDAVPPGSAPAGSAPEALLYDFTSEAALDASRVTDVEAEALVTRFPHPHAAPGARCLPYPPGTPPGQRPGGILLPTVTEVAGSFTSASPERAVLIDYCPGGSGVPRTRRLLVFDGGRVVFDRELPANEPADAVLHAADVDGDGRAELVLVARVFHPPTGGITTEAALYRLGPGTPRVVHRFRAFAHCYSGHDESESHRIFFRRDGGTLVFRDEAVSKHCTYPPAPPRMP